MKLRILLVDDDPIIHKLIDKLLQSWERSQDINIVHCESPKIAMQEFVKHAFQIAFIDLNYPSKNESGFDLIKKFQKLDHKIELVVLSSQNDFLTAQRAIRAGASDYLLKGFGREEFFQVLNRALERKRWKALESNLKLNNTPSLEKIIGNSNSIQYVREQIIKASSSEIPILIEAETGSGKELVARSIHEQRQSNKLAFVAVDCGAIPKELSDSFFFGHEKGAFTGADSVREGVFEQADGGTLFLDEINSLPLEMQAKLLRVLQEKEFRRLGANKIRSADFRLVAATNKSLETMVENGEFREDLFYRINVVRIEIPPLRKRTTDLKILINHFMPNRNIDQDVFLLLKKYAWPGNIRELKNTLLALDVLCDDMQEITLENLPDQIRAKLNMQPLQHSKSLKMIQEQRARDELHYFNNVYKSCGGNLSEVARSTGMDRSYLHQKLIRLGIHKVKRIKI